MRNGADAQRRCIRSRWRGRNGSGSRSCGSRRGRRRGGMSGGRRRRRSVSSQRNDSRARWRRGDLWRGGELRVRGGSDIHAGHGDHRCRGCAGELLLDQLVHQSRIVRTAILADEADGISRHLGRDIESVFGPAGALNFHGKISWNHRAAERKTTARFVRISDGVCTRSLYQSGIPLAIANSLRRVAR